MTVAPSAHQPANSRTGSAAIKYEDIPQRTREAIRALYDTGFFRDVELRRDGGTLVVAVLVIGNTDGSLFTRIIAGVYTRWRMFPPPVILCSLPFNYFPQNPPPH